MIAGFLCGVFYGVLLHDAWRRERENRRLEEILVGLRKAWVEDDRCECGECCGCGTTGDDLCESGSTEEA